MAVNVPTEWQPGTKITMCKVPWDSGYRDVVQWADQAARDEYFAGLSGMSIILDDSTYCPIGMAVQVAVPYSTAYGYNYLVVENNKLPTDNEDPINLYYFITSVTRPNPASSLLGLQLDVWTTYHLGISYGYGYLERSQLALANNACTNSDNWPKTLNDYWTISEGLDLGDAMMTYYDDGFNLQNDNDWVVITSTASLSESFGTVTSPSLIIAEGGNPDGVFSGCEVYTVHTDDFPKFVAEIKDYSWVAQCIISITTIPSAFVTYPGVSANLNGKQPDFEFNNVTNRPPQDESTRPTVDTTIDIATVVNNGWSTLTQPYSDIPKFYAYPYSVIEMTNWDGTSVFLKPQLLHNNVTALGLLYETIPPFLRFGIYPIGYGAKHEESLDGYTISYWNSASSEAQTFTVSNGDFTDVALWYTDFPSWSIVNNSYIAYMASNANTIAYNYSSAKWTYDSATASAERQYELATDTAEYDYSYADWQASTTEYKAGTQLAGSLGDTGVSLITLGASSLLSKSTTATTAKQVEKQEVDSYNAALGNAGSALGSASGLVSSIMTNQMTNDILAQQRNWNDRQRLFSEQQGYKNYQLANKINQGNYDNAIAGLDAGYADAQLTPPSQIGSAGGNGLRYKYGLMFGGCIRYKRVSDEAIVRSGTYFRRYGCAIHRYVKLPDMLNVCKYYTYYKTIDLYITCANANETTKDAIRGIFAQGVSVWSDPAQIGKVAPVDNVVTTYGDYY